jgi:uncharacterized protein (TIGR00266 family)
MEYKIVGGSMQVLDISLSPQEKIYADSGKLVSKSEGVIMTPRLVGGIINALERKITGATGMLTEFSSPSGIGSVSLAGVFPGKIKEIVLKDGEVFISEDYAFLAAEGTVKFTIQMVGLGAAFYGQAGIVLQKFVGPGSVFIHVVGDIVEYDLDENGSLEVDPGHIAGFDGGLNYKITFVDNIRTAMFGGVGLFLAKFTGKGRVILHSVSRLKLASEIYLQGVRQQKKK